MSFDTAEAFQREYAGNVSNGGIFLASEEPFEVRQPVRVRIELAWVGESHALVGEVVHVVPLDLASAGATPGAAVQFETPASEVRERFQPFLVAPPPDPEEAERLHGRRSAPRSKARVRARVHCPGYADIAGRTRDLSSSGVLVSVAGEAIAVGEPVQVFITDPKTGEEREILGKVARHAKGDGGLVRAIGIQFYMAESERKSVEKFIRSLTVSEHSRHLGGIQGSIEELGLVNLVQTFGVASPEGTLDVMRGVEEGYIAFERGMLRAAEIGGVKGVKALARMLAWSDGHFEFHARIDPKLPSGDVLPLDAALLDAMRMMDESADVDRSSFPPEAMLGIDAAGRDTFSGTLTKLEEAVLDLAAAGTNVQRMLDIIPETDDEIYIALEHLADEGLIAVRNA